MKQTIYGLVGGISSVIALDAFIRLIISIYYKLDIMFIGYSSFPGFWWPLFLVLSTAFTSFFGGMLAGSVGRKRIYVVIVGYVFVLLILRVTQLQYLISVESAFYASSAIILSMIGVLGSWLLLRRNLPEKKKDESTEEITG